LIIFSFQIQILQAQNGFTRKYIEPNSTDNNITEWLSPHYIVHNNKIHEEPELIIFFPGTGGKPEDLSCFTDSISQNATHTIGLSYPNTLTPWTYCQDKNEKCFELFRREVLWGSNDTVEIVQNINKANSVINRFTKLLEYLSANDKDEGWSDFLNNGNIVWSKIILGGYSQGGGLSLFISKQYNVKRVVMFSSPSDYFIKTEIPAPWLAKKGETDCTKIFSFSSQTDEVVPFYMQLANWESIGILGNISILYSLNSLTTQHQLTLEDGGHGTPVSDKKYSTVWNYLFNTSIATSITINNPMLPIHILQMKSQLEIEIEDQTQRINKIFLYNCMGKEIYSTISKNNKLSIPISNVPIGIYLLTFRNNLIQYSQKIFISY